MCSFDTDFPTSILIPGENEICRLAYKLLSINQRKNILVTLFYQNEFQLVAEVTDFLIIEHGVKVFIGATSSVRKHTKKINVVTGNTAFFKYTH
jgi:hypothetical protein